MFGLTDSPNPWGGLPGDTDEQPFLAGVKGGEFPTD